MKVSKVPLIATSGQCEYQAAVSLSKEVSRIIKTPYRCHQMSVLLSIITFVATSGQYKYLYYITKKKDRFSLAYSAQVASL